MSGIAFLIFAASDMAKNTDIDTSKEASETNKAVYYSVSGGKFTKVNEKATGDFGKEFSDIVVSGELSDSNGNIEFAMQKAKISASYINQSKVPNTYDYNYLSYELDKKYTVDSDIGVDQMYQGYVYYPSISSEESEDESDDSKELCKYLQADGYFNMVMCEDKHNIYTTINTAQLKRKDEVGIVKNNAIYKFNKESKETSRILDVNIHTEGKYIEAISCNDRYIYMLINESEKYSIAVYDKDSASEVKYVEIDIYVNLDDFAKDITKDYEEEYRKVKNYEIQENGYNMYANEYGIVLIHKNVVAEIDENDPKHYGEKGYNNAYEEKGIEPFVKEVYTVSAFSIADGDIQIDNTHICVTNYIYDFVYYKNGLTYVLTNMYGSDSDVLDKVRVTSLSNGKIFEEININLNKISNTSGSKTLKYLKME